MIIATIVRAKYFTLMKLTKIAKLPVIILTARCGRESELISSIITFLMFLLSQKISKTILTADL
jgi:hypothetical protein